MKKNIYTSINYFTTGLGFGIANATYTILILGLFLKTFSIQQMPAFWVLSGCIGFVGWYLYSSVQIKTSYARLCTWVLGFSFLLMLFWGFGFEISVTSPILIQYKIFFAASFIWLLTFLWRNLFVQLTDRMAQQYKYDKQKNIGVLGTIIGEASIYLLVALDIYEINWARGIWITLLGLSLASLGLLVLTQWNLHWKNIVINAQYISAYNNWSLVAKQKYLRYLIVFAGTVGFLFATNDYFFYKSTKLTHTFNGVTNLATLEGFLATVLLGSFLGGVLVKMYAGAFIIRKYGLKISMLIMPAILTFLTLVIGVSNTLDSANLTLQAGMIIILVITTKFTAEVLREGLMLAVYRIYLLPIESELRTDTQHKVETQMFFIGIALSGMFLSFTDTNFPAPLNIQMFGIMIIWAGLAYFITYLDKEYKIKLQQALLNQSGGKNDAISGKFVPNGVKIKQNILKNSPETTIVHLNILQAINPLTYKDALLDLLDSKDGRIRQILKEADEKTNQIIENINAQAFQMTQNNEIQLKLFAVSLYKKTRKFSTDRKKETVITDDKVWNWVAFVDDKVRLNAINKQMYEVNAHDSLANETKEQSFIMEAFAKTIENEIFLIAETLLKNVQQLTLLIDEKLHKIALDEARRWCVLEAIPVLYVILNSKYLPVLIFADVIKQTYNFLRGAEYRLERLKYLEQLTQSKLVEERSFGALLSNYADEQMKSKLLNQLLLDEDSEVKYFATIASACTTAPDLQNNLIEKLNVPFYGNASFSALKSSGENIFPNLELAFFFAGQSEIAQKRILQIYGHLGTENSIELLLKKINLSNEFLGSLSLDWLSKNSYRIAETYHSPINIKLEKICEELTWNMSVYLDLERHQVDEIFLKAMQAEIDNNFDKIFGLMALIYDAKTVELVKDNIRSGDIDKGDFATELLDVFMKDTTKALLKPLLKPDTYANKVYIMQENFPTEPLTLEEALIGLVRRDYKNINIWTKSCALDLLSKLDSFKDPQVFLANVGNPELMLSEIANMALFYKFPEIFEEKISRLHTRKYAKVNETALKIKTDDHKDDIPSLKFEVAKFLQTIPELSKISGLNLAKMASLAVLYKANVGEVIEQYYNLREMDYYLIVKGSVCVKEEEEVLVQLSAPNFFHNWHYPPKENAKTTFQAISDCVVYKIKRENLNELISLEEGILANWLNI
ncbi:MAG: hypothetical protein EAZ85_09245 [Bacteroidetes bacterium]|nr:MAG: hypothetical protein EAZ85_09245 [Bacteroidota bacterium]TAG88272.1 MAG: hypothetical protein EAZ20_08900 [Bacteroidota bacterium]